MKRVLVIDANQRSALAVTRSLGARQVPVITADETESTLAGSSQFSRKNFILASPLTDPEQFLLDIADICRKEDIDIVIPMTELTTLLLLYNNSRLLGVNIPFADPDTVDELADKVSLMRLADSLEVPIPKTFFSESASLPPEDTAPLGYPVVLKPGKSWLRHDGRWLHTNVRIADSPSNVAEILSSDPSFNGDFMKQEFIPGKGAGVFAIYESGEALAFFAHRRLREKPPQGGVSVLSESTPVDPVLESFARRLLDHVGWHGVAMVEFRITPEGKPYLMEVNTRFWGSLQLAVDAGVDFPWMLYQLASGEKVQPVKRYKTGTRLRWLLGDLDHLYLVLRDPEFTLMKKIKAVIAFLTPAPFKTRHEVNRWNDMGPFWWELKQYLRALLKRP